MKKLILLLLVAGFGFSVKAQTDSAQLAKNIIAALKSEKVENLQKLVAPPEVYKAMFKETEEMTDDQIIEKTSKSPKLKSDFEALISNAKEKKVNLNKLKYKSAVIEVMPGGPYGVSITFAVKDKTGKLAVSALKHNDNWYLMEILITTTVFEDF